VYVQGRLLEEMLKLCDTQALRIEEHMTKKQQKLEPPASK
jgi:hypothetical protein